MKKTLFSFVFVLLGMTQIFAQIAGDWKGTLEVQGMNLELIFHITETPDGISATLDVPAQGATGLPLSVTKLDNDTLHLAMEQAGIKFVGVPQGQQIIGTYFQAGMELPLVLEKTIVTKPGETDLVSTPEEINALIALDTGDFKYRVEDYFTKPITTGFQLSPNGKYLLFREKDTNNKRHVMIKEVATGETLRAIEEKDELIRGTGWINDDRLIYIMDEGGNENYHLFAIDRDGGNNIDLTPFDSVQAGIINMLKEQKDYIIIRLNKDNKQVFEPYKVNVKTGDLEKLFTNDDPENAIVKYDFDKEGVLRGYAKLSGGINEDYYYKEVGTGEFVKKQNKRWDETFHIASFNYASDNKDEAYVISDMGADRARILLYDLKENKEIKEIFADDTYDAQIISLSRKRNWEVDYVGYEGAKVEIKPVSETFKKIYADLASQFKGYQFVVVGRTDEEDQLLIVVTSDKLYGRYYHYDTASGKATLLVDLMPQLKEEDMAEMRPIQFTSRDGVTIHGYITLPQAALDGERVPLIVNPHGGPQQVRDSWGFNAESQLFASRGYATLQVNFRISGGYGKEFVRSGFKQVGRKAMDDVEDGIQYAIEQGWVDKDNVAIYGASHGGYAVLRGLTKTPELYKAGVDYVGVSNIFTLLSSIPDYWKPFKEQLHQVWYDLNDPEEAAIAEEVSPIFHVDKIQAPLFVVQGANDPRVKIAESDQIVKALRSKGVDVPYMVKYDEGHGFHKEENQIEFYKAMMGFFSKHLN